MASPIDINGEKSWATAKTLTALLEPIPASIGASVQLLWRDFLLEQKSGKFSISDDTLSAVRRFEKSSKLKTPLYFAASTLFPQKLSETTEDDSNKALITILGSGLFSVLLGLVYFHKRMAKICAERDWTSFSKEYVLNMELGYIVGSSIPALGPTLGTLLGGIRFAGLATFYIKNADQFSRYRNLKKKKFDLEYEHEHWGCDHAQVSGYLIQRLAMRKDLMDLALALRCTGVTPNTLPQDLKLWNAGVHMIEQAKEGARELPDSSQNQILKLDQACLNTLETKMNNLFKNGSSFTWMLKQVKETGSEEAPT